MKNVKVDVAIMGSGVAGLTAGITCLEYSASVAVFEKRPFQGGAVSNCAIMGFITKNDPTFQSKAVKNLLDYTKYCGNPDVIRAFVNNSHRFVPFLDKIGAGYQLVIESTLDMVGQELGFGGFPGAFNVGDVYFFQNRGKGHGAAVIGLKSREMFEKLGGQLFLDTPVVDILMDGDRISGAIGRHNKTGEEIHVECKAVLVCNGGFSNNPEMIKKYTGHTYTNNNCDGDGNVLFNHFPTNAMTGDGQQLCWKLGAAKGSMGITGHNMMPGPGVVGNSPWICFDETRVMQEQPYLWVNRSGARFIDEIRSKDHMAMCTTIAKQPGKYVYIVFDDDTREYLETHGPDFQYVIFPAEHLTDIKGQFKRHRDKTGNKHAFMADTIEELCKSAGIDEAGMKNTLNRYNGFCETGLDKDFGKESSYLRTVKKGPFYALRVYNGGYSTNGGIKVNGRMEVLDEEMKPIKGLYAAGDNMVGEMWGDPPIGGGGGYPYAFAWGAVSADSACEYMGIKEEEQ